MSTKVNQITKKSIREMLLDIEAYEEGFNWRLSEAGAYLKFGEVRTYYSFCGQGISEVVYNGTYDEIVDYTDIVRDDLLTRKNKIDNIFDKINEMVESYYSE